jgi:hypothetical protein
MVGIGPSKAKGNCSRSATSTNPSRTPVSGGVNRVAATNSHGRARTRGIETIKRISVIWLIEDSAQLQGPGLPAIYCMQNGPEGAGRPSVLRIDKAHFDGVGPWRD